MEKLQQYITESLFKTQDQIKQIQNKPIINIKHNYKYFPETFEELVDIIDEHIQCGGNNCNLNDIDISKLDNLSYLFDYSNFNGDISEWDVSNINDMHNMFYHSKFNGDISNWDVSNVKNMSGMFYGSEFNGDISNWDVSDMIKMENIFAYSPLQKILLNGIKNKNYIIYEKN